MTTKLRMPARRINTGQTVRLAKWLTDLKIEEPRTQAEWEEAARAATGADVPFRTLDQIAGECGLILPTRRDGKMSRVAIAERLVRKANALLRRIDERPEARLALNPDDLVTPMRALIAAFEVATPSVTAEGEPKP